MLLNMEVATLVAIAVVAFASTNIDDIFLLLGFFSDREFRAREVVIGQFLGMATLFGVSVIASLVSLILPAEYLRLLGLAPMFIGARKLFQLWRGREANEGEPETDRRGRGRLRPIAVAAITIANGGDNIGVYAALFAGKSACQLLAMALVFAMMTAAWCAIGHWLVGHPTLGAPIRRHGHWIVPFVLMAIGGLILFGGG